MDKNPYIFLPLSLVLHSCILLWLHNCSSFNHLFTFEVHINFIKTFKAKIRVILYILICIFNYSFFNTNWIDFIQSPLYHICINKYTSHCFHRDYLSLSLELAKSLPSSSPWLSLNGISKVCPFKHNQVNRCVLFWRNQVNKHIRL
jgi:hypothetical protein